MQRLCVCEKQSPNADNILKLSMTAHPTPNTHTSPNSHTPHPTHIYRHHPLHPSPHEIQYQLAPCWH